MSCRTHGLSSLIATLHCAPRRRVRGQLLYIIINVALLLILAASSSDVNAAPIRVPDLSRCDLAVDESVGDTPPLTLRFNCCLPLPSASRILDFSFDKYPPIRQHVRRPAHTAKEDYIAKYNKAYQLMRALPDSDPRSLKVQADIHCAFCNGAYMQAGADGNVPLQVHFSWLFLPWHRWFLYFHERILGNLLGDPGFSLLYWNWDDQVNGGNMMPEMFARNGTALYDAKRNPDHLPPAIVRLSPANNSTDTSVVVNENLNAMYQSVVTASTAELFAGGAYRTGSDLTNSSVISATLGGSVENGVHNGIHYWTGNPAEQLLQDMGTFSTASRDPIFYAHHSNVDRLWDVWRFKLPGGPRKDHSDPDFLDTEFLFYDENANLVKVKVSDALDNAKLGVSYKTVRADDLWINYSPKAVTSGSAVFSALASGVSTIGATPSNGTIDLDLASMRLAAIVQRPIGETRPSKAEEVLVIQGLELTSRDSFISLVVFVNLPDAGPSTPTNSAEYVGTFNIVPSASQHRHLVTNVKFEIGDNLKRIGLQKDDRVVITIVLKSKPHETDSNLADAAHNLAIQQRISFKGLQITYE
ncbi:hypothetical protein GOP47_0004407 [Adiantum capillus-veneris]|uniref:Tyrosinase copper-binding domain-containing protein n=1 Tax=Adiantum capillus-veneris TaxID=13818 RepID=A0A9D4V7H8_ADICA|nr:hypothetical protein GOP47_0004407 [Adiantum capillus-veneris]